jgi:hypothetical protein
MMDVSAFVPQVDVPALTLDRPAVTLDDVEWRAQGKAWVTDAGGHSCVWVPYLKVRSAARLLDEWVGPDRWRDSYQLVVIDGKEAMQCTIEVLTRFGWIAKVDVGTAGNFEAQKGMMSDAFKRCAGLKWGCGRQIYAMGSTKAPCRVWQDNLGKPQANAETRTALERHTASLNLGGTVTFEDEDDEREEPATAPQRQSEAPAAPRGTGTAGKGPEAATGAARPAAARPVNTEKRKAMVGQITKGMLQMKRDGEREAVIQELIDLGAWPLADLAATDLEVALKFVTNYNAS